MRILRTGGFVTLGAFLLIFIAEILSQLKADLIADLSTSWEITETLCSDGHHEPRRFLVATNDDDGTQGDRVTMVPFSVTNASGEQLYMDPTAKLGVLEVEQSIGNQVWTTLNFDGVIAEKEQIHNHCILFEINRPVLGSLHYMVTGQRTRLRVYAARMEGDQECNSDLINAAEKAKVEAGYPLSYFYSPSQANTLTGATCDLSHEGAWGGPW